MKAYTDLEQSKKLMEILPLESADMFFRNDGSVKLMWEHLKDTSISTPCWSLAALLDVLPCKLRVVLAINDYHEDYGFQDKYAIGSVEYDNYDCYADNPVDACYEMILKLHKKGSL